MELRSPTAEDLDRIHALFTEAELAESGEMISTRADVEDFLAAPGLDLTKRARVAGGDRLTGFVAVHRVPLPGELRAQLVVAPDAVADAPELLRLVDSWSVADRHGAGSVTTTMFELPDFVARQALIDGGWEVVHSYTRMKARLEAERPVTVADSVTIEAARSTTDMRVVHAVIEDAVSGHWKHERRSFEEFVTDQEQRAGHDPSLWFLARRDGQPAGAIIVRGAPDHAWIGWLGVHPYHRGQGIASALLNTAFNGLRCRGHESVGVDVDTHNATDAGAVYEHAGMKVITRADQWSKTYR